MLNDYQIALLLQQQYDGVTGVFDHDFVVDGDRCSIKYFEDSTIIVDEGSHDFLNWFFNFQGMMQQLTLDNITLGVETGFNVNMTDSMAQTLPLLPKDKPVICSGHSRGAGRAWIRAARLIRMGYDVYVVVFGSPRPGNSVLATVAANAKRMVSYCNGRDPVCRVPVFIPLFAEYIEPAAFVMLNEPPAPSDVWGHEAGWHHMNPNYLAGVAKACGVSQS